MTLLRRFQSNRQVADALTMVRLAWASDAGSFAGTILIQATRGLFQVGAAWITKLLFDTLAAAINGSSEFDIGYVVTLVVTQSLIAIAAQAVGSLDTYFAANLVRKLDIIVQRQVYGKLASITGLAPFENPKFHTTVQLATEGAQQGPSNILSIISVFLRGIITIVAFLGILLAINPLLSIVVCIAVIPQHYTQLRLGRQRYDLAVRTSPKQRWRSYYQSIMSGSHFAKELRVFNLVDYFLNAWLSLSREINEDQRQQQSRELRWQIALATMADLVSAGAFLAIVLEVFQGDLSLGDLTLYSSALISLRGALLDISQAVARMHEGALFLTSFREVLALSDNIPAGDPRQPTTDLNDSVQLRNVSFRYSDNYPWVLRNLDLIIPAGKCVALVGLNGSGKTTLVKLLTRLYDPTEGDILWDGADIRTFNPVDYRLRVGVIFQDFVRYDLTVQQNIGLGDIRHVKDNIRVKEAAVRAGVHGAIVGLPQGYETILSLWLGNNEQGVGLSGGEWQKVALARLFMRPASLLILDEPTAALDAEAEHEFYRHFVELIKGKTALLIAHRFSTVRMADIIAVLEHGHIVEYGTHDELIASKGRYAQLYDMQLKGLRPG